MTVRPLLAMSLLAGCLAFLPIAARAEGAGGDGRPFWPPPPAAKRLVFLESFSGPEQLGLRERGLRPTLKRLLFGRERREIGRPYGVAATAGAEKICVADPGRRVVHVFDRGARRYAELKGRKGEDFLSPIGVALDGSGNLFVSDSAARKGPRIRYGAEVPVRHRGEGRAAAAHGPRLRRGPALRGGHPGAPGAGLPDRRARGAAPGCIRGAGDRRGPVQLSRPTSPFRPTAGST